MESSDEDKKDMHPGVAPHLHTLLGMVGRDAPQLKDLPSTAQLKIQHLRNLYLALAIEIADISKYSDLTHNNQDVGRTIRAIDELKISYWAAEEALVLPWRKAS